jgi:hypothetical protein
MPGPEDETAAAHGRGRGDLRASRADREQVVELLKDAFVEDRLTKEELDERVGHALASRTYAELAAVTSDLHAGRPAAGPAASRPPSTPARTLAKAARRSGMCMLAAFAVAGVAALIGGEGLAAFLAFLSVVAAVVAASGFLGYGVVDAWQEHRSRGRLPPRPGRDDRGPEGRAFEGGQPGRTGRDPAPPGARTDQTRADLRTHRPAAPIRAGAWAPRGTRPVPGAI